MEETKKSVCRVCLAFDSGKGKYLSLFEKYNDTTLSAAINSFVNFTIKENDGLPDKICSGCLLELECVLRFREKCEKSYQILQGNSLDKIEDDIEIKQEPDDNDYLEVSEEYLYESKELFTCVKRDIESLLTVKRSRAVDLKLICHDCGNSFKSKCKLTVHWRKVHLPELLFCNRCKRQFKSFKAFNKHKIYGKKACAIAGEMHIEGAGKSRIFHCKSCEYKTSQFKNIQVHLLTHSGERPYPCNMCSKRFSQISSLHGHKENVHKEYRVEAACTRCGKVIKGRGKLYKHMMLHREAKYPCEECKKLFKTRQSLKVHMLRHSGYKGFTCEFCAASFYTGPDLINHKKSHHELTDRKSCDICGYETKAVSTLFHHRKKHTDTNVCCILCGKFLSSQEEYTEHKKFHFGKKYPCPACVRTYNCRKSFLKHMSRVHQDTTTKPTTAKKKIIIKKECTQIEN